MSIMKTPSGPTRLGYRLATGGSLPGTDTSSKSTPRFARGGLATAASKGVGAGAGKGAAKAVGSRMAKTVKGFTGGVPTSAAKNVGTVKTTSNVKGPDPKGYALHGSKGRVAGGSSAKGKC